MRSMASRRMEFKNNVAAILRDAALRLLRMRSVCVSRLLIRVKLAQALARARRLDIEGAGALVLALAFRQRSTAMPAGPRRERKRLAGRVAAQLVAREI